MKKIRLTAGLVLGMLAFGPLLASAQIAPSPCDDAYFDSLESRAWLETQREITQNQNLIFKPDSVLSYTCFNQFGKVLANMQSYGSTGLFSESNRWGDVIDPRTTAMDDALGRAGSGLVAPALEQHFANFSHSYLGGRTGTGPYKGADMTGGAYTCNQMDEVWKLAKCYDFQDKNHDGFFTFEEHQGDDKRKLPSPCANPSIWEDQRRQAGLIPTSGAPWPFDKMETYFERFDPAECGKSPALPTGVVVRPADGKPVDRYNEKVCIQPGCYYQPSGLDSGQCTSN